MAHALLGYDGLCKHIHGHSYKLFVSLIGIPIKDEKSPKQGMVIDFSDLKQIVKEPIVDYFDHALVLNEKAAREIPHEGGEMYKKIHLLDIQPTCENLVLHIVDIINSRLPEGVELFSVRLYETATSFAEWCANDN